MTPRLALVLVLASAVAGAAEVGAVPQEASRSLAGRPLADVLRDMQKDGLRIVFSSELVREDMRIATEPKAKDPRKRLDEVLRPHGLDTQPGPNGALLVIRRAASKPGETQLAGEPTGTIRGVVVDAVTGAPLEGVVVQLQGTALSVRTDAKGTFAIEGVASGRQTLYVSLVGYALARPNATVKPGTTTDVRVALARGTTAYSETVTVRPEPQKSPDLAVPAQQHLDNQAIQSLRGVLADDPIRAVHALPGVSASDDYRSEFSVRAADFNHVGVSIDGLAVPWPLHAVRGRDDTGSIALINSDVLDRITLTSAAYPQRAGSATGAWIDFGIREGSRSGFGLHGAVSATSASAVLEGPIGKDRGSWIASIRRSYLDWLLKALEFEESTAFGFLDHQSKLVFDVSVRHQVQLGFVAGYSGLDETEPAAGPNSIQTGDSHTAVVTGALRSVFGRAVVRQRVAFISQGFDNGGDFGQALGEGSFRDVSYGLDASLALARGATVEIGGEVRHAEESRALRQFGFPLDRPGGDAPLVVRSVDAYNGSSWLSAAFVHAVWNGERFAVSPGVRLSHWTATGETLGSPWIQGLWQLGARASVRAGAGLYQQFPRFDQLLGASGNPSAVRERARHIDVAFEHRLNDRWSWKSTVYHRSERDMLRLENAEPRLVDDVLVRPSDPRWANALKGSSRGVELSLQRVDPNGFSGWLSYAYGRARYDDARTGESFPGDFDQRHTINVFGQYRVSGRTNLSAKFRSGSNVPLAGYFVERDGGLYAAEERNQVRLPVYTRLDLRADRTFHFTRRRLTLFVEVLNVLNRENVGPADGVVRTGTQEAVGYVEKLFPLLPAAGFLIEF